MKVLINDIYANLKEISPDKLENVAIWGWTNEGLDLLTLAINERIHVKYFVDYNNTIYKNEIVFDKRVITREELAVYEDVFVLIDRKSFEKEHIWIEDNLKGRYLVVDIGELASDFCNIRRGIYIYGAGIAGQRTLEILREKGIEVEGFIDSNEEKVGAKWCDYPIYSRKVLCEDDIVIISALYWAEIYDSLKNEFHSDHIYVDYRNSRVSDHTIRYEEMNFIWLKYGKYPLEVIRGDFTIYGTWLTDFQNKELSICGNDEIVEQMVEILGCLGIAVSFTTDNFADLACLNLDNQMILVAKVDEEAIRLAYPQYIRQSAKA